MTERGGEKKRWGREARQRGKESAHLFSVFFERFLREFGVAFESVLYYFLEKELVFRHTSHMETDAIVIQFVT